LKKCPDGVPFHVKDSAGFSSSQTEYHLFFPAEYLYFYSISTGVEAFLGKPSFAMGLLPFGRK